MHTKYKGYWGEIVAKIYLFLKGYSILYSRYKTKCGEIDIIAKKDNTIVFVEVKNRKSLDKCYLAIKNKQIDRIKVASCLFINKHQRYASCFVRFDFILVYNILCIKHIDNI